MSLVNSVFHRCTLVNLDQPGQQVEAYFNPKEIGIDKKIPWNPHKGSKGDLPTLEFTNADPMTLTVELFFDCYEEKLDVFETHVEALQALTLVVPGSRGEARRPPRIMVVWGNKRFLSFDGVITSLATKYTMFLPDGTPVRATCAITMQQIPKVKCQVEWTPRGRHGDGDKLSALLGPGSATRGRGSPGDLLE